MSYAIVKKLSDDPVLYSIQKEVRTDQLEIYETYSAAKKSLISSGSTMEIVEVVITRKKQVKS